MISCSIPYFSYNCEILVDIYSPSLSISNLLMSHSECFSTNNTNLLKFVNNFLLHPLNPHIYGELMYGGYKIEVISHWIYFKWPTHIWVNNLQPLVWLLRQVILKWLPVLLGYTSLFAYFFGILIRGILIQRSPYTIFFMWVRLRVLKFICPYLWCQIKFWSLYVNDARH